MKTIFAVFALVTACASRPATTSPVTVVVMADQADRGDAARLQSLVVDSVRHSAVPAPRVVTIKYFGAANAVVLPPWRIARGVPDQLVFVAFTIADRDGKVLRSEWLPYRPSHDRLAALHETADIIAARVTGS